MSTVDKHVRRQERLRRDVFNAATQPQLSHSSIDGGWLEIRDGLGNVQGIIGEQFDGTYTIASVGGTPPPSPSTPMVTPKPGGLALYWDGTWADESVTRMDFRRVTFHAVADVEEFDALNPAQIVGEITVATGGEVFATLPPTEWFVFAVAWSDAGLFSFESDVAFGTPLNVVDQDQFDQVAEDVAEAVLAVADAPAVYRQGTQPVVPAGKKAIWYDTSSDNASWYFDGTDWTKQELGPGALAAEAVISETIAVGALDGKVITGALVQTDSAPETGIKLLDDQFVAYDDQGDVTAYIDGATGAVSLTGPLISGASLTSPVLETDPTVARGIKIVGNVFSAYDSQGVARAVINGSTGEVTLVGKMRTGLSGTKRVELGQNTQDASAVEFYSGQAGELGASTIAAKVVGGTGTSTQAYLAMSGPAFAPTDSPALIYMRRDASGESALTLSADRVESIGEALSLVNQETFSGTQNNASFLGSGGKIALVTSTGSTTPGPGSVGSLGDITIRAQNAARIESQTDDVILQPPSGRRVLVTSGNGIVLQSNQAIYRSNRSDPIVNDEGWVTLSLTSSWGNADQNTYMTPAFRIINGVVYLRGTLARPSASTAISTFLPSGARPNRVRTFSVRGDHSSGALAVQVRADGGIFCTSPALFYWLDQISFALDY